MATDPRTKDHVGPKDHERHPKDIISLSLALFLLFGVRAPVSYNIYHIYNIIVSASNPTSTGVNIQEYAEGNTGVPEKATDTIIHPTQAKPSQAPTKGPKRATDTGTHPTQPK